METFLTALFRKHPSFSGACLVTGLDGEVFSRAAGLASRVFTIPNTVGTRFACASVSKVFTAAAVLTLVQEGRLRLEDKIHDIIDLRDTKIHPGVTVFHLLTHTSGIADDADEEAGEDFAALFIDTPNYSFRECRDYLKNFVHKEPNFAPGTGVRYNNCAFILLGLAIEELTGERFRDFVTERVFIPCGIEATRYLAMDEVNPNTAESYAAVTDEAGAVTGYRKNIYMTPPVGCADGGAYTTVRDMDRFLSAVRSGELLSPELSAELMRPQSGHLRQYGELTWRTGFAFEFLLDRDGKTLCMYKEGADSGVEAMLAHYPQSGLTVSLLSNENGSVFKLHREIREYIFSAARG